MRSQSKIMMLRHYYMYTIKYLGKLKVWNVYEDRCKFIYIKWVFS